MQEVNLGDLISEIVTMEWKMLISVTATDDPYQCQENPEMFQVMRTSQHIMWNPDTLQSYLEDVKRAEGARVNLVAEKYAHMMRWTHPGEYAQIRKNLRPIEEEAEQIVEELMSVFSEWNRELDERFPHTRAAGRPTTDDSDWVSVETYLRCELLTYSLETLRLCKRDVLSARDMAMNLCEVNLQTMAKFFGFASLAEMEAKLAEDGV